MQMTNLIETDKRNFIPDINLFEKVISSILYKYFS